MKKIMMILVVLVQTTLFAQSKQQTIEKPLKLASVTKGTRKDSLLIYNSAKDVKFLPISELKTIINLDTKVDKVAGKSLLSNSEITRIGTLANYTHPANHPPSIILQDAGNRFVTDAEKAVWNLKQPNLGFTPENSANKNAANGFAGLGSDGKLISSQLPSITISDTFVTATQAAMLAVSAETGDVAVRTDLNKSFILKGANPAVLVDWQELLTPTSAVTTVFGRNGAIISQTGDYIADQIYETGSRKFQTANQQLFNDATSSIQMQLNGKQASGSYETSFSKLTGFNKNFGTATGTVAEGNDSRILNGQTAFGWGNHASAGYSLLTGSNINQSSFRTALGLGSNAYTSTGYLPLTGGALTGSLSGTSATFSGTLTASGGFFNSDLRLKNIIRRDGDIVYFKWKDNRDSNVHIGYIAQLVQKTHPNQIKIGEDENKTLSVNYIEILVEKIRILEKKLDKQKKQIKKKLIKRK